MREKIEAKIESHIKHILRKEVLTLEDYTILASEAKRIAEEAVRKEMKETQEERIKALVGVMSNVGY